MYEQDDRDDTTTLMRVNRLRQGQEDGTTGKARVVVLSGEQVGRKYIFEEQIVVGRSQECMICLEDPQVSRKHAIITRDENGLFLIEDLKSRNGTIVNNQSVQKQQVVFGDRIKIGKRTTLLITHFDPGEDKLLHRQKMEAIGRLGAGIAHDFNNLLGALTSSVDFLEQFPQDTPLNHAEIKDCLSDMHVAIDRGADLTRRLLGFASRKSTNDAAVDLSILCEEIVHLAQRTFPKSITVESEIRPKIMISGDSASLHQLVMNLCINARDALPEGGKLKVLCDLIHPEDAEGLPSSAQGYHAHVRVEDNGVGMDPEVKKRVFEPFFTTKQGHLGSGLGLATVYEVIIAHGGHIDMDSELGKGTTFNVYLPAGLQEKPSGTPRPTMRVRSIPTPGSGILKPATILLVDDNEVVRKSASRLLSLDGHQIVHASNGLEAIDLFRTMDPAPHLIILDLDMPVMGGEEAFKHLLQIDPKVRVIFISGYLNDNREQQLTVMGAWGFLRKPFDAKRLKEKIHLVLTSDENPLSE